MKLGEVWKDLRACSLSDDTDTLEGISIVETWDGLSHTAPIKGEFDLKKQSSRELDGTATYSAVVRGTGSTSVTLTLRLPCDACLKALTLLDAAELEAKEYRPTRTHTDDYPMIRVELRFGENVLILFSKSQGKGRLPWEVSWGKQKWVTASSAVPEAMKEFEEYLHRDVERRLIEFARTLPADEDISF